MLFLCVYELQISPVLLFYLISQILTLYFICSHFKCLFKNSFGILFSVLCFLFSGLLDTVVCLCFLHSCEFFYNYLLPWSISSTVFLYSFFQSYLFHYINIMFPFIDVILQNHRKYRNHCSI